MVCQKTLWWVLWEEAKARARAVSEEVFKVSPIVLAEEERVAKLVSARVALVSERVARAVALVSTASNSQNFQLLLTRP